MRLQVETALKRLNPRADACQIWNADEEYSIPGDQLQAALQLCKRILRMFQDMIEAIRDNREPVVNGEEAKKALAIVLAMYQSVETGKEVAIS